MSVPLLVSALLLTPASAQAETEQIDQTIRNVHDPAVAKEGDSYYLFSTGAGIPVRCSDDMETWTLCSRVFFGSPRWHREMVPGAQDIWAPDISFFQGRYFLYYSVSIFGTNTSAIGLATNETLDPNSARYRWRDEGVVIASDRADDWNAIDPNLVVDRDGLPWLAFGSYWSGLKLVRLDPATGKLLDPAATLYPLASRDEPPRAIEAPFVIYRKPYYYLFASFDACCRGVDSTYNVRVGRAKGVIGPYLDREGVSMLNGGGTLVLEGSERWRGPGHNAVISEGDRDLIVYHAYDAEFRGSPTLRIDALQWDEEGWPRVAVGTGPDLGGE